MIDDLKRKIPRGATYNDIPEDYAYNQAIDDLHAKGLLMVWQPIDTVKRTDFRTKILVGVEVKGDWQVATVNWPMWGGDLEHFTMLNGDFYPPTHWMPTPTLPKGDA